MKAVLLLAFFSFFLDSSNRSVKNINKNKLECCISNFVQKKGLKRILVEKNNDIKLRFDQEKGTIFINNRKIYEKKVSYYVSYADYDKELEVFNLGFNNEKYLLLKSRILGSTKGNTLYKLYLLINLRTNQTFILKSLSNEDSIFFETKNNILCYLFEFSKLYIQKKVVSIKVNQINLNETTSKILNSNFTDCKCK